MELLALFVLLVQSPWALGLLLCFAIIWSMLPSRESRLRGRYDQWGRPLP